MKSFDHLKAAMATIKTLKNERHEIEIKISDLETENQNLKKRTPNFSQISGRSTGNDQTNRVPATPSAAVSSAPLLTTTGKRGCMTASAPEDEEQAATSEDANDRKKAKGPKRQQPSAAQRANAVESAEDWSKQFSSKMADLSRDWRHRFGTLAWAQTHSTFPW